MTSHFQNFPKPALISRTSQALEKGRGEFENFQELSRRHGNHAKAKKEQVDRV